MKQLENSLTTSFSRHAPRSVSVQLPQIDDEIDISVAPEAIRETSRERANKWRDKASRGRRNQMFTVNSLVIQTKLFTVNSILIKTLVHMHHRGIKRETVHSHVERNLE